MLFTGSMPQRHDQRTVHRARSDLLERQVAPHRVRTVVAESWLRSAAAGVDAEAAVAPILLDGDHLADYRAAHPLSAVFPLLYDVLGRAAEDCDCVMAVGDADGQLLWVVGQPAVLRRVEAINFVEGASWDEVHAGTNAPGTALRLDTPVQIQGAEHFNRLVQPWSCTAAPIHDPRTQEILGIIDITGGEDVAAPQTLAMVRAGARMAEAELARLSAVARAAGLGVLSSDELLTRPSSRRSSHPRLRLLGLGRTECEAEIGSRAQRLSPRHSEILVCLLDRPDGLTGDQLALEVYPSDVHRSTMRAELTRLRALLGQDVLESRPYRLIAAADSDWQAVGAHLAAGRVRDAVRAYAGPLLPQSEAPGVVERREALDRQLRAAILAAGEPDLMVAWTRSRWGAGDLEMWQRQAVALPASSPLRPMAAAEATRLERQLSARR